MHKRKSDRLLITEYLISVIILIALCILGIGCSGGSTGMHQDDTPPPDGSSSIKPFGVHGENDYQFDPNESDIAIDWVRYGGGIFSWASVEPTKNQLDFTKQDPLVSDTAAKGISVLGTIRSFNPWDQCPNGTGCMPPAGHQLYPVDEAAYISFLRTMVERYDGDGIDDAPGSPVVKAWQVENEVDGAFWDDTAERYATLLIKSYQTIKEANPEAKVVLAGSAGPTEWDSNGFYQEILDRLASKGQGKQFFDVVDIHWYGNAWEYRLFKGYEFAALVSTVIRPLLEDHGYVDVPIWITETATYGGVDVKDQLGNLLPAQDERVQASELVRRFIYFLGGGAEKVYWYKMIETHHSSGVGIPNDYFENTGLINNPDNDGDDSKKLAFYSYKLLVQKTEGCDWNNLNKQQDGADGVYDYVLTCTGRGNLHVVWLDPADIKTVTIPVSGSGPVTVTKSVPDADQGKDVTFPTAFTSTEVSPSSGSVSFSLGSEPVYVEESQ